MLYRPDPPTNATPWLWDDRDRRRNRKNHKYRWHSPSVIVAAFPRAWIAKNIIKKHSHIWYLPLSKFEFFQTSLVPLYLRILAFSWSDKNKIDILLYAKIIQIQMDLRSCSILRWLCNWVKNRHEKSKKKLCNCGVNYTKIYYIIYMILSNNSNGYISHCGGAR